LDGAETFIAVDRIDFSGLKEIDMTTLVDVVACANPNCSHIHANDDDLTYIAQCEGPGCMSLVDTIVLGKEKHTCSRACRVQLHRLRKFERAHVPVMPTKWTGTPMARPSGADDVPDVVWSSDNVEEMPTLLLDRQITLPLPLPVIEWGGSERLREMNGVWHFYVHDYRFPFDRIAWQVPKTSCQGAIEPNYSIHPYSPLPGARWQIYQKRWLARYWQEVGLNIAVDLCVPARYQALNLAGVPRGWQSYATRGFMRRQEDLELEYEVACDHAAGKDVLFMVISSSSKIEKLCGERGWFYIEGKRGYNNG